jgi:hypothetical protein
LTDEEKAQPAHWVRRGRDLTENGVISWRLSDLRKRLFEQMFVILDERSVGRICGFRRSQPSIPTDASHGGGIV